MDDDLRGRLLRHARFSDALRGFFSGRGYAEVDTPTLAPFLIPEPSIEVYRTTHVSRRGRGPELWLVPSPELWMKRLLARGSGSIFQISRCFRNGDCESPLHNPEFRLLEWYTVGTGYLDAIEVAEALFAHLLDSTEVRRPRERLAPPFARMTMEEAFHRFSGIDLAACQESGSLAAEGKRRGVPITPDATWEEAFHILFLTLVEPSLPRGKPLALLDYPALIPTTARRKAATPWAERWELYVDGVEVANCYTEETDRGALEALIAAETERKRGCLVPHEIDTGLAGLFPPGFPTCTGTALGVDRLEMIFLNEASLEGVIVFPFSAMLRGESRTL